MMAMISFGRRFEFTEAREAFVRVDQNPRVVGWKFGIFRLLDDLDVGDFHRCSFGSVQPKAIGNVPGQSPERGCDKIVFRNLRFLRPLR